MTEKDFAALLGRYSASFSKLTIKSAIALMQSVLFNLMPQPYDSDSDLLGATVVQWDDSAIILQDSKGRRLYRVSISADGNLEINQDINETFYLLENKGSLGKVFAPDVLAELSHLIAEAIK